MHLDALHGVVAPRRHRRPQRRSRPRPRATAVSSPDINTSNGTCYAGPDARLDRSFLACGNAAVATQACCWAGDVCLEDRACFGVHDGDYVTYLAGCTDAAYSDANACPDKRGTVADAVDGADPDRPVVAAPPWVGLAYCNGSSDQWVVCPQPHVPATLQSAAPCACPTQITARTVALAAGPTLAATAQLPATAGGRIVWVSPYTPTVPAATSMPSSSSSSQPEAPSPSTSLISSTTQAPTTTSSPDVALVVGLSVGIGGFVLLIALTVVTLCLSVRRSRRMGQTSEARRLDSGSSSSSSSRSHISNGSNSSSGSSSGSSSNGMDGGKWVRWWWPAWGRTKAVAQKRKGKQATRDQALCEKEDEQHPSDDNEGKAPITATATAVTLAPAIPVLSELEPRPARPWSMRSELEGSSVRAAAGPVSPVSPVALPVSPMTAAHARSSIGTVLTSGWLDSMQEEAGRGHGASTSGTATDMQVLAELEG